MSLDELLSQYLAQNPNVRSDETRRLLSLSVRHLGSMLGREPEAADLTDSTLVAYIAHRRRLSRAETTIEREVAKLVTLANYAALEGLAGPLRQRFPKATIKTPIGFTRRQLTALFCEAAHYGKPRRHYSGFRLGRAPAHVYMSAFCYAAWYGGERMNAVYSLERDDVLDVDGSLWWLPWRGMVRFRVRKRQGRTIERRIGFRAKLWLRRLMASHDGPQLFAVIDKTTLYVHWRKLLERSGVPVKREYGPHCLRRTAVSTVKARGGDAQDFADHESEQTTRRYYYVPRITDTVPAIRYLFDPLSLVSRIRAALGL